MPGLAVALGTLGPHRLLIDGELVVQDSEGRSRFGLLQAALADGDDTPIRFMAFDLLAEGDSNLEQLPLAERKARLKAAIEGRSDRLLYSDHIEGEGDSLFSEACRLGLEGIVSKRADAPYRGRRTADWLKVKCAVSADFRIVGWLPSDARMGFRSLLLASGESKALRYAGKVGTGFTGPEMEALLDRLGPLETKEPPVSAPRTAVRGARWVRPELEAEVGYAEITAEGVLRHARFLRLRDPADRDPPPARKPPVRNKESPMARAAKAPPGLPAISSRDRIVFPEAGLSKGDLADWYVRAAPHILAQAGHRPLSLVRCPDGIAGKCFFQKHSGDGFTGVRETRADAEGKRWLYVDDAAGLLGCVQMGAIEFHGWGSRVGALDRPDRLVFDLDPDEGLPFIRTADAALELRDLLAEMGLASFPMLSGGKGVHVVIPLDGSARWPAVKDFAHRFATALETRAPGRYTARAAKAGRTGRIFIDWMRNQKGATSVMPWTVRARPAASVAVPLSWGDLGTAGSAAAYTLADPDRIIAHAERLTGWGQPGQPLPDF
jgi:bifunctional non-homologous end joining protein LigD